MHVEQIRQLLTHEGFPRSAGYDPLWVAQNAMGPHPLVLTEWACQKLELRPGDRVLDMGCGKALSSVFLAKEFGVEVWATDLWITADDNLARLREMGVDDRVFPIHADARNLPFAAEFFDAIVCVDSYFYYGTDERYLSYFAKFVKPGGQLGIVVPGLMREFKGVPEHLLKPQSDGLPFWRTDGDCWSFHTKEWWQSLLSQRDLLDLTTVDTMPNGWRVWGNTDRAIGLAGEIECSDAEVLDQDQGKYLGLVRIIARRRTATSR
jgi:SAM-dependent methyltransferase